MQVVIKSVQGRIPTDPCPLKLAICGYFKPNIGMDKKLAGKREELASRRLQESLRSSLCYFCVPNNHTKCVSMKLV